MRVELPPEPVHFVNRDEEQRQAGRAVQEWQGRSRPLILALSGPAGLGKSELAHRLARRQLERFPDGVLSVDLDDFRDADGVFDPGDVLGHLLGCLDVEPALLAEQFTARCRQYWNRTRDAGLLLVVDNARYGSELDPLLPASGGSVVIVASHGPLRDLERGAALDLPLEPLDEAAAVELLRSITEDDRLDGEPEAAGDLVRLCGGLPLAVHGAGRWLTRHSLQPLSRILERLRESLDRQGISGAEGIWDAQYEALSAPAARLYRLLPHHPAATFTLESATALLGLGPETCLDAFEELELAGLIDLRVLHAGGGRTAGGGATAALRLLAPIRSHALRRSRRDAAEEEAEEAQTRVVRWLVRQAQRADRFAAGPRLVVAPRFEETAGAPDAPLDDPRSTEDARLGAERAAAASRWLYEQRLVLFAGVRLAHARGLYAETVALSEPVWTYALDHPHQSDVERVFRLAVDAALRDGAEAAWLARTCCQLARPLWESGRFDEAGQLLGRAAAAVELLGNEPADRRLRASVTEFGGMLDGAQGEWDAAVAAFTRSREIHRTVPGSAYGVMLLTYRLGEARAKLGELRAAHVTLAEAHGQAVELGRERMTGRTGFALAGVLRGLGRPEEARHMYEQALASARRRRSGFDRARIHDALAELAQETGRGRDAEEHREAAQTIRRQNGLVP